MLKEQAVMEGLLFVFSLILFLFLFVKLFQNQLYISKVKRIML